VEAEAEGEEEASVAAPVERSPKRRASVVGGLVIGADSGTISIDMPPDETEGEACRIVVFSKEEARAEAQGELRKLRAAFDEADADSSGDLDAMELGGVLKKYMKENGVSRTLKVLEREVQAAMEAGGGTGGTGGTRGLDFEELVWLLFEGNATSGEDIIKLKLAPEVKQAGMGILHEERQKRLRESVQIAKQTAAEADLAAAREEEARLHQNMAVALGAIKAAAAGDAAAGFEAYAALHYTFSQNDVDESGELDVTELTQVLKHYQKRHLKRARSSKVVQTEVESLLGRYDADKSGGIAWWEFILLVSGEGGKELKMELPEAATRGLLCCGLLEAAETCEMRLALLGSGHRLVAEAVKPLLYLSPSQGSPLSSDTYNGLTEALEALGISSKGRPEVGPSDPCLARRGSVEILEALIAATDADAQVRERAHSTSVVAAAAAANAEAHRADAVNAEAAEEKAREEKAEAEAAAAEMKKKQGKNPPWVCELWPLSARWHKREGLLLCDAPTEGYESAIGNPETIWATPDQVYIHLLRDGASLWKEISFRYNLSGVKVGKWKAFGDKYYRENSFHLRLKLSIPLLPDTPQVLLKDCLYFDKTTQSLLFETEVAVPNMPQGEKFTANGQLRFDRASPKASTTSLTFETRFTQRTFLRYAISAAAYSVVESQKDILQTFLTAYLRHHGCRAPNDIAKAPNSC